MAGEAGSPSRQRELPRLNHGCLRAQALKPARRREPIAPGSGVEQVWGPPAGAARDPTNRRK